MLKAVQRHTDAKWVLLYVGRWLKAPMRQTDGSLAARDRGTPQGSAVTPPTQWITRAMVTLRVGFGVVLAGG
jgi:retron-type reverse transcriptase